MLTHLTRASALALLCLTMPALAGEGHDHAAKDDTAMAEPHVIATTDSGIEIRDGYARASTPNAKAGAAFLVIENTGTTDDRLIAASTDIAARTELHTHTENDQGVMRMIHVKEGFDLPAGATLKLARGGKHVMMMGLNSSIVQGGPVNLTLTFEQAGDVSFVVLGDMLRNEHGHKAAGHGDGHSDELGHEASTAHSHGHGDGHSHGDDGHSHSHD